MGLSVWICNKMRSVRIWQRLVLGKELLCHYALEIGLHATSHILVDVWLMDGSSIASIEHNRKFLFLLQPYQFFCSKKPNDE